MRSSSFGPLRAAQHQPAARAAKRFVGGGGNEIRVRHRSRVDARGYQAGDVGHIHKKNRAGG